MRFTIGEVANLLGITPKTIRHYHAIGLLSEPDRDANQYRLYGMAQIEQLQHIIQLKRFGLSLEQIQIVVKADYPDDVIRILLRQHAATLRDEIARLEHQLSLTKDFLDAQVPLSDQDKRSKPVYSSMTALSQAIKPRAGGVSDILLEVEGIVLGKLDQFDWQENYEWFWYNAGKHFIETLQDEGMLIFWMERYLALATMESDDLQGSAWLQELRQSPVRRMLARSLLPALPPIMPEEQQQAILKLLPTLLYEEASLLQKQFLQLLMGE